MKEKNITTTTIEKKRKKENMCQLQTNISEVITKLNGPQWNENENKRDCNDFFVHSAWKIVQYHYNKYKILCTRKCAYLKR